MSNTFGGPLLCPSGAMWKGPGYHGFRRRSADFTRGCIPVPGWGTMTERANA